jgi:branched-chain amino acid transport system substrate-binding protein
MALLGLTDMMFHNRTLASDLAIAAAMRAEELGLGNMAQLAWKNDAGESMIAAADPFWEKAGKSIVATEYMEIGAANIDTQVAKIRVSNPDWVALWTFSPETGLALKKLREFGVKVPLIGVEYTGDVKELAGASAEGYEYATDFFAPSAENPWSEQFAKAYRERYGEEPEFYAANYYENVYVLAEAIRRERLCKGNDLSGQQCRPETGRCFPYRKRRTHVPEIHRPEPLNLSAASPGTGQPRPTSMVGTHGPLPATSRQRLHQRK